MGTYGSQASREKYRRIVAEWLLAKRSAQVPSKPNGKSSLTISEVILANWKFAETYYCKDALPTKELSNMRDALRPLRKMYGGTPAADFGPVALKAVRQQMINQDVSRGVINHRVNRIRRMFQWAASEELIPVTVFDALRTVTGLRAGRSEARETEPVVPVDDVWVDATLPFVAPQVAAIIQLQRLTGMRPGEVVVMRMVDVDSTGDIWIYRPHTHKNSWRGQSRSVPLGPQAQAIIRQHIGPIAEAYLFSPQDADAWHRQQCTVHTDPNRKTPIYPSELRARERNKRARKNRVSKRPKRECYDTASYRRAITYGIKLAKKRGIEIPHWHPHQLRHARGTEVRKQFGLEAAQVALGHARADVTQIYAERNLQLATDIARKIG